MFDCAAIVELGNGGITCGSREFKLKPKSVTIIDALLCSLICAEQIKTVAASTLTLHCSHVHASLRCAAVPARNPPNTGNVIRLCANTGARLHLIEPLGFDLDDRRLKRAGLDYHEYARMQVHPNLSSALAAIAPRRLFALSTRGQMRYDTPTFSTGDAFIFGPETRGLPDTVLHTIPESQRLYLPMQPQSRSLNLSNAVAVMVFEAWRQQGFQ